jgi:hypothetical protein
MTGTGEGKASDQSPSPKRSRGRLILAGVLLCVAGVAGWWCWPRGDARLVGKWAAVAENDSSISAIYTFHSNGIGFLESPQGRLCVGWRTAGHELRVGFDQDESLGIVIYRLPKWLRRMSGFRFGFGSVAQSVEWISHDEFRLRPLEQQTAPLRLRRITD